MVNNRSHIRFKLREGTPLHDYITQFEPAAGRHELVFLAELGLRIIQGDVAIAAGGSVIDGTQHSESAKKKEAPANEPTNTPMDISEPTSAPVDVGDALSEFL